MIDLGSLSNEQLDQNLRQLRHQLAGVDERNNVQQATQELQVHRIEVEMLTRALREARTELEHAAQRYVDLHDNLPLAYLTLTPVGQIAAANRAACEWLRLEARELAGTPLGKFLDGDDAVRFGAHLDACLNTGRPGTLEATLRLRDGRTSAVQIASRPVRTPQGGAAEVHVVITDLSQLRDSQKGLAELNLEQEAFNHSISHDLRAPVVTINNYASIVLGEHGEALPGEARMMVQRIQNAALRMEATLRRLLEYTTLAHEEIVLESVDIECLVSDLIVEHRGIIEERAAEVSIDSPLPVVKGSRSCLHRVFAHVLANALEYTEPGKPPCVRISAEANGGRAVLKIRDEGIGIDPRFHERVFRIFERLHGYSQYPGSGIGLAIARRAAERMGGRIWVESEPGRGSCFCVELPKG